MTKFTSLIEPPHSELHERCIAIMSKRHFTTVDGDTVTTTQVIAATPATESSNPDGDDSLFPDDPIEITVQGWNSIDI